MMGLWKSRSDLGVLCGIPCAVGQNNFYRVLPTISCTVLVTCVKQKWTEIERVAKKNGQIIQVMKKHCKGT